MTAGRKATCRKCDRCGHPWDGHAQNVASCGSPIDAAQYARWKAALGREATVWLDTGGLALTVRLRLAWAVLRCRPVEMQKRHPASDTVFPL